MERRREKGGEGDLVRLEEAGWGAGWLAWLT